jgi:endonuclease/exonuclease/phosphatase family metal-dependent hydrolase
MHKTIGFAGALLFAAAQVAAIPPIPFPGHPPNPVPAADNLRVMTRNQYLGADLTPVILAQTPAEFLAAAQAALAQIAANDFPTRSDALAREVRNTRPDVIGLQEVFAFSVNGQFPGPPFVDHLQTTLDSLAEIGEPYTVAARVEHLDVTLPIDVTGDNVPELIRVLDRDVILVRRGVPAQALAGNFLAGGLCGVPIPNPAPVPPFPPVLQSTVSEDGCNYTALAQVSSPVGPIVVQRGFVGVDVRVRGRDYRVIDTHLEVRTPAPGNPASAIIQSLQSVELVGTLQVTTPPGRTLVALGDFNSSPVDLPLGPIVPPYQVIAGSGYTDVWDVNRLSVLNPDGFTCCQASDLANTVSEVDERIDLVFVKDAPASLTSFARVTGQRQLPPLDVPPNWASDHFGVAARLRFLPH